MMKDQDVEAMARVLLRELLDSAVSRGGDVETVMVVLGLAHDGCERILTAATVTRPGAAADLQAAKDQLQRLIAASLPAHDLARAGADAAIGVKRTPQ